VITLDNVPRAAAARDTRGVIKLVANRDNTPRSAKAPIRKSPDQRKQRAA